MKIFIHKNFIKRYKKLRPNDKKRFKERRDIFLTDPFNPILNNHALGGEYKKCRSINVTGDIRVIYLPVDKNTVLFVEIGSHSQLYK